MHCHTMCRMRLHVLYILSQILLHAFVMMCLVPEYIICLPVQCTGRIKMMQLSGHLSY